MTPPISGNPIFSCVILGLGGLVFVLLGLVFLIAPGTTIAPTGLVAGSTGALTEVRSYYGAFEIVIGLYLFAGTVIATLRKPALIFLAISMIALVLGRSLGLWIDGGSQSLNIKLMLSEFLLAALALTALLREKHR